jgi:hypothetical protein
MDRHCASDFTGAAAGLRLRPTKLPRSFRPLTLTQGRHVRLPHVAPRGSSADGSALPTIVRQRTRPFHLRALPAGRTSLLTTQRAQRDGAQEAEHSVPHGFSQQHEPTRAGGAQPHGAALRLALHRHTLRRARGAQGHNVSIELALSPEQMVAVTKRNNPDLVVGCATRAHAAPRSRPRADRATGRSGRS